jgi:negative regulator of flagellin synthesis FlgM
MSNIDPTAGRTNFFPNSREGVGTNNKATRAQSPMIKRNDYLRQSELDSTTKNDAKVDINNAVKDFSRIKKAVDAAPPVDNSAKIASLKEQIQAGTYKVDYDALTDKLLAEEL